MDIRLLRSAITKHLSLVLLLTAAVVVADNAPIAAQVAAPAANGRIVFATDDGMASINPDGSGPWGLRFTRIGRGAPAWSPDGSEIAFTEPGGQGIYVTNPDGTALRPLVRLPGANNPAWSPDGKSIAFDDGVRLYTARADGTAVSPVVEGVSPTWSPDGNRIAYSASGDVYVVDRASGVATRITANPASEDSPAWSPSGDSILYVSDQSGAPALFTMQPDGARQTRVTVGPFTDGEPAWSPDGTQIAFVRNGQVWVARSDGSEARRLVSGNAWSMSPAWQPLLGTPGECTLSGTMANDLLVGTEGADVICGGDGDDTVVGLGGNDLLRGGDGADWIAGGTGSDVLLGGGGDDRIDARDGDPDQIDGGTGRDAAVVDRRGDRARRVERRTASTNVAAWRPTTASNEEVTNPSVMAVDGRVDDYWSSGGYPPQWIQIDLQRQLTITSVRLIAHDLPAGAPVFLLGSSSPAGAYRLLHRFDGPMVFKQALHYTPRKPWRNVRFVQLRVPVSAVSVGWIAWPEIEVYSK
jgi:dipeptidyl aminopeptidase/acylaminoacyl peptidase